MCCCTRTWNKSRVLAHDTEYEIGGDAPLPYVMNRPSDVGYVAELCHLETSNESVWEFVLFRLS